MNCMAMRQTIGRIALWFNITIADIDAIHREIATHLHGKLLDVGCGQKQEVFKPYVKQYIGLDNPKTLSVNHTTDNCEADVFGDAMKLPFKKNTFDCVTALSLYEHLPDPQKAAHEAYRVLKKGGTFALLVPFMYRLHTAPYDYFRFTEYGLRHILETAGFKVVKIEGNGGMWKMIGARLAGYFYSDLAGMGYADDDLIAPKRRAYLLPVVLPLIAIIVILARFLDKVHCVKKDNSLFYAICTK